jgi:predicted transcriptional regulator
MEGESQGPPGSSLSAIRSVAVKLDQSTRDRLQRLAAARDRSAHWMMREAITQYLEREEKREAYRQDGMRAWQE